MAESYNRGSNTRTVSFRLEAEGFEKLEQEAHNQGIIRELSSGKGNFYRIH